VLPALGDPASAGGWAGGSPEGPSTSAVLGFWDSVIMGEEWAG